MDVGADAALGAKVAGNHLGCVVRRMTDLTEIGVRLVARVAVVAVVRAFAAMEILVHAGAREAVESFDGVGERLSWQSRDGSQLFEGVGLDDHPGLQPLLRNPLSRLQSREYEPVPILLVENQPGRNVLTGSVALAILAAIHAVARLDVRHGLIHEPVAGHVDDDGSGGVPLGQSEPRRSLQWHRRTPPSVLHQFQCGAKFFRRSNPIAGVGLGADRPVGGDGPALILHPHLFVVLESTAAEDHSTADPDQGGISRLRTGHISYVDAPDDAVFVVEVGQCGIQQNRNARVLQSDS